MLTFSRFMLCCTGAVVLSTAPAKADGDWTFNVLAREFADRSKV